MVAVVNCEGPQALNDPDPCDREADLRVRMKDGTTFVLCNECNAAWWMDHEAEDGLEEDL